jgi:two-component system LytT family response regulator
MKIIVVDDEIASLSIFLSHVIHYDEIDYKFFQDNPEKAIDYVKENPVDGAFLDIQMPQIDGITLAREIVKVSPVTKIVFITGYTYDVEALKKEFGSALLGFAHKPYDSNVLNRYIEELHFQSTRPALRFKTFGSFDLFVNGKPLHFSSSKSKELLALLVAYEGSSLTMDDAIGHLWPEKNIDLAKRLYRDAVWRLRSALKDAGLSFLVDFKRAILSIKTNDIDCDYWSYLHDRTGGYEGAFLTGYDWSLPYQDHLDDLA